MAKILVVEDDGMMRELVALHLIPVIFLTCNAQGEPRGKELGAIAHLSKPLVPDQLLSLVSANVPRHPPKPRLA